ncbi:beta strand repeat-containing protein, partial [Listeria booriae]|uniref:beta strand repeat-containing protein n=1 Tax=Listeria booriae TaxID=1552123 RepID=UPI001624E9C9
MINKKRVNKVTKLTVASAIAFSALAQPLGTVITVKAAEAPATTKAENKLLQASALTASVPVTLKNTQFTSTETSIPDWSVSGLGTRQSDGSFRAGTLNAKIKPSGQGSFQVTTTTVGSTITMYQTFDTIPGVKYTFKITYKGISTLSEFSQGCNVTMAGINSTGESINSQLIMKFMPYVGSEVTKEGLSFTATTNKSMLKLDMGVAGGAMGTAEYSNFSLTASGDESIATPTINTVTDNDTVVTGTGTAGKTARIELPDGTFLTGTVGADGKYSIEIPKQAKDKVIKVMLYDGQGNVSPEASTTVVADTVAPPTINAVTSDDTIVKGTGVNGATVTLTIAGATYTGTVSGGEYSITIPKQSAGTVISATESLNGKTSTSVNTTVTQGTVAAPTISGVTSDDTTVKGTGIKGATVTVTIGSQDYTATVDQSGNYSVTIPKQAVGTQISAKQSLNGQTSGSVNTTVTQGAIAAPTIGTVTTDDTQVRGTGIPGQRVYYKVGSADWYEYDYATVAADGTYMFYINPQQVGTQISVKHTVGGVDSALATTTVTQGTVAAPTISAVTSDDTTVKGTGIKGATVTVTIGSQDYTATVDQSGNYSVTISKQAVGTEITAKQTVNSKTSDSVSTTVTQGTVAAPTIGAVTTDDTTVKGTGIKGATVTVTIGGQDYTATVDQSGNYSVTISKQAFGTEITAKQTLNSQTSSDVTTTVTQGTVAPPTINPVTTDDQVVKGTGINGATVTVMIGSQEYTATVTNNEYSVAIPKQSSGTIISAKQTLNNKTSTIATTTVGQGTVAAPTINSLTTDDVVARGTGITGAVVTITIGSATYTGTVVNGNYAIEIPKQAVGTVVYAKQTLFNQTSSNAQTTVTQGSVSAPTINAVTTDSTTVTGTGINGATVTVKIGDQEYPATVANGTYSVTIPKQAFGTEITAKQSLGGKTSDAASTTVTQGTVSNPTINAVTSNDTTVTGSGITGATVTVSVGGQDYSGTVTNGAYSITIPKQAAGTEIKAKQSLNGKTSGSVSTIVTQGTLAAPTINDYTVGDGYVTGSAPAGATKVALYVGNQLIRYAAVTDGKYRVYAGDNAAMGVAGTAFQVAGVDTAGTIGAKASSTVKPSATVAAPTINDFYARDAYAKGTATGASKVTLYVNNVAVRTATVAADGSYSIYTGDQASLATAGNTFQVQAANAAGKTSTKTTATVKEKLAAPTINDFYAGDAYAKGIAAGASKVTLYVNNVAVRTAAVAANGSYSIYTGDQASLTTAGNTFQIQSTSAAGTTSTKTTGTVKAKTVVTAPTIKDYYVGDAYAKGVAAGASKVTLYVNNVAVRTASVAADGSYSIYAGDQPSLATAGNTFQVQSTTASGATSTKTTATVKEKVVAPTINDFYAGDAYAKGTATGASKVTLYVNNVAVRTAAVAANGTYSIYTGDQASLGTAGNTFQVQSTTAAGTASTKTTATVKAKATVVAPTINDFYAGDAYAKGTATGASKVTLYVNNVAVRTAAVAANGTYTIYTGDQASLGTAGNTFQIQSTTASGATSTKTTGTVKARIGAPTIADYYTTDVYAKGTAPTGATKVALYVQNVLVRYAPVTDGKYTIYTGDKSYLTTAGNTFQVAAVDAKGNIGTKATGTVKVDDRAAYKLTANDYNIATDETVTGTAGSSITRVQIEVDGVIKRQTTVGADGNYAIYAKDLITSTNNIVKIIGLDAQGVERNRATANVKNESSTAYSLTASDYNIATDETVTGTAGSSITRVQIEVDGVIKRQTSVGADGKYAIYAKDVIKNTGNVVKIIGLDAQGNERNRATVTVKNESSTAYQVTAGAYNIATDETVTGTAGSSITRVQIEVDGVIKRQT